MSPRTPPSLSRGHLPVPAGGGYVARNGRRGARDNHGNRGADRERANGVTQRPESDAVRALIERGMDRSATFRTLNARLDGANVIVYVRFSPCAGGAPACLLWASEDTDARRLLIKINRFGRSTDELTALLAHELQHANEVASDAEITDLASFRKSFALRGWTHGARIETEEAGRIARQVAAELSRR